MNNHLKNLENFFSKICNFIRNYGLFVLLFFIILAGIFLRIKLVLSNQSFGFDECALTSNILTKSYIELLKPLDFGQVAPPLFLFIEKFIYQIFGEFLPIETTFRIFPCLCSILSLILLPFFVHKVYKNSLFTCGVAYISAFIPYVVNYANEVKQYSCELLVSIILISFFYFFDIKNCSKKKLTVLAILIGISPWISLSSLFVIAVGSLLLLSNINQRFRNCEKIKYYVLFLLPLYVCFLLYWLLFAKAVHEALYAFMLEYWQNINPAMFNYLNFYQMFSLKTEYFLSNFSGIDYHHWHLFFWGNLALLLFFKNKKMIFLILGTLILTIIAGFFQLYPYEPRLILFLFPFFAIIYMQSLLFFKNKYLTAFISITLFVATIISANLPLSEYVVHKSEIRNIFEKLKEINPTLKNIIAPKSCYICYGGEKLVYDLDIWKQFEEDKFKQMLQNLPKENYFIYLPYKRFNSSFNRELRDFLKSSEQIKLVSFYSFGEEGRLFIAEVTTTSDNTNSGKKKTTSE